MLDRTFCREEDKPIGIPHPARRYSCTETSPGVGYTFCIVTSAAVCKRDLDYSKY
jgi:hypothetical protein